MTHHTFVSIAETKRGQPGGNLHRPNTFIPTLLIYYTINIRRVVTHMTTLATHVVYNVVTYFWEYITHILGIPSKVLIYWEVTHFSALLHQSHHITAHPEVEGRRLKLKAKFESGLSCFSFKR